MNEKMRKPDWIKVKTSINEEHKNVRGLLDKYSLNTVCDAANCPNMGECFNLNVATFMILGKECTRNCKFCAVSKGAPETLNQDEPENVGKGVKDLNLDYVVITSVTRDDLSDGGAGHFAKTIRAIKQLNPNTKVEVLIPDLEGDMEDLQTIIDAKPDVIAHNVETVPDLYPKMRPMAVYKRSLDVVNEIKKRDPYMISKSGIMLGVGETRDQVVSLFDDLRNVSCDLLSIGQYLAPSKEHHPVLEFVTPQQFDEYKEIALQKGFLSVASSPLTRSSHLASVLYDEAMNK